jgi:MSHA pilin protein MshC
VELVLVVALIGLLAAIGGPRFFARRDLDERRFASDVTAALRQARRLAVATGCPVETRFDGGILRLAQLTGCAGASYGTPVADPATGAAPYQRTAPPAVALASTVDPLRFDALGRALDTGGTVRNANVTVGTLTVSVVGATGLVRSP